MSDDELWREFARRAGLDPSASVADVIGAIQRIPYARPAERTPAGVVSGWRGTCSTKHALLLDIVRTRWPDLDPRVVHRVYRMTRSTASAIFGDRASIVPADGVIDVHSYLTFVVDDRRVKVDATVPTDRWNGNEDLPLACADGIDVDGGDDPWKLKAELVDEHCEPIREAVIRALSAEPGDVESRWERRRLGDGWSLERGPHGKGR